MRSDVRVFKMGFYLPHLKNRILSVMTFLRVSCGRGMELGRRGRSSEAGLGNAMMPNLDT